MTGMDKAVARVKRPPMIIIYGPPKTGKTTDEVYSFPRAAFLADAGALIPSVQVVGYAPTRYIKASTMSEVYDKGVELVEKKGATALVVDDWSLAGAREKRNKGGYGSFEVWREFTGTVLDTLDLGARFADELHVPVIFNCHPIKDDRNVPPGGPEMPTGPLTGKVPRYVDGIYLARVCNDSPPECGRYTALSTEEWVAGDRLNIVKLFGEDGGPMNLGEIIRAYGVPEVLPRAPGMEWMEDLVERATKRIMEGEKRKAVFAALAKKLKSVLSDKAVAKHAQVGVSNWDTKMATWVFRDVTHRIEIRRKMQRGALGAYGVAW